MFRFNVKCRNNKSGFLLLFLPHKALLVAHGKRSPGKVSPARI